MAPNHSPANDDTARRALLIQHPTLNGIDHVEIVGQSTEELRYLHVYFLKPPPDDLAGRPELFSVEGRPGVRVPRVISVRRVDDHLIVEVDRPGALSTYTLRVKSDELDPAYSAIDFTFWSAATSPFVSAPRESGPPKPPIDYLAKDYASFRRALLDLLPTLVPGWTERHAADLGITLAELLAYVGDQLSYYQDAVANEAYLDTARQRVSVRRHARLLDYRMHEGASAQTLVHFQVSSPGVVPEGTPVLSQLSGSLNASARSPCPVVIPPQHAARALGIADLVFETISEVCLHPNLNEIKLHDWGHHRYWLPRGATGVDLVGDLVLDADRGKEPGKLKPGDLLLLEEVRNPETVLEDEADPAHRQVVRLTRVKHSRDSLLGQELTRVTWNEADALQFSLCVSNQSSSTGFLPGESYAGTAKSSFSVARGNLALADHGRILRERRPAGRDTEVNDQGGRRRTIPQQFRLSGGPLSFRRHPANEDSPARALFVDADSRDTEPQVRLEVRNGVSAPESWVPVTDLLNSGPFDRDFVVEINNTGQALLRFGDGEFGMVPPQGARMQAYYRVGLGKRGNTGPDYLVHAVDPGSYPSWPTITQVRNPIGAWGGVDPEDTERTKRLAPASFRKKQYRAVTEEDYARFAEQHPEVSAAAARFRWTGSWRTVFIAIDPRGRKDVPPELRRRVEDQVSRYALAGHDLAVRPPVYVPLDIEIEVRVDRDHYRSYLEEVLLAALGDGILFDGSQGFFHPDNFSFANQPYLSQIYAAVEAVEGVASAAVTRFGRFWEPSRSGLDRGYISVGPLEVVRMDNDPSAPENGRLQLNMEGGR